MFLDALYLWWRAGSISISKTVFCPRKKKIRTLTVERDICKSGSLWCWSRIQKIGHESEAFWPFEAINVHCNTANKKIERMKNRLLQSVRNCEVSLLDVWKTNNYYVVMGFTIVTMCDFPLVGYRFTNYKGSCHLFIWYMGFSLIESILKH